MPSSSSKRNLGNGSLVPISFPNRSRGNSPILSDRAFPRVPAFSNGSRALDGVSWSGATWLNPQSALGTRRMRQNRRRHPHHPSGNAPLGISSRPVSAAPPMFRDVGQGQQVSPTDAEPVLHSGRTILCPSCLCRWSILGVYHDLPKRRAAATQARPSILKIVSYPKGVRNRRQPCDIIPEPNQWSRPGRRISIDVEPILLDRHWWRAPGICAA